MRVTGHWAVVALTLGLSCASPGVASACVSISSASDLDLIRSNLADHYCLTRDIELTDPFVPIGSLANAFTGTFRGRGYTIRGLTIVSAGRGVGLFAWIHGGRVSSLTLAAVSVKSTRRNALVGGVTGFLTGEGRLSKVHVTGAVKCSGDGCRIGGIVGEIGDGILRRSSATASVAGGDGGAAGGATGQSSGAIFRTFATGRVSCGSNCAAGGFVGWATDFSLIFHSFAAGPVQLLRDGVGGGFAGYQGGTVIAAYATGLIRAGASAVAAFSGNHAGKVREVFGAGHVMGGAGGSRGGLAALLGAGADTAKQAYWDADTTQRNASVVGIPRTTAQLQAGLPAGFDDGWNITKGYSYPFLNVPGLRFASTLATLVKAGKVFTFLPIGQFESMEYARNAKNTDKASLAAVYTMIARAIGVTKLDERLDDVAIDRYFWDDVAKQASWDGPVTGHAKLLALTTLPGATPINDANILGALKRGDLVILRGAGVADGQNPPPPHWMLATLFRGNNVVANDPWTGLQVLIDMDTKRVVKPEDFPLARFKVDAYRVVTFK